MPARQRPTDAAKLPKTNLQHFAGKAKHVIYLHMVGGPPQMDLFDYKPVMNDWYDKDLPESVRKGQRLTTMTSGQARFPIAPSKFKFAAARRMRHVAVGVAAVDRPRWSTTCASSARMHTEAINHEPAISYMQTGNQITGRPCLGAWASYGLGSLNEDLPTFVVLVAKPTNTEQVQAISARLWSSRLSAGRARRRELPQRGRSDSVHQQSAGRADAKFAARRSMA